MITLKVFFHSLPVSELSGICKKSRSLVFISSPLKISLHLCMKLSEKCVANGPDAHLKIQKKKGNLKELKQM